MNDGRMNTRLSGNFNQRNLDIFCSPRITMREENFTRLDLSCALHLELCYNLRTLLPNRIIWCYPGKISWCFWRTIQGNTCCVDGQLCGSCRAHFCTKSFTFDGTNNAKWFPNSSAVTVTSLQSSVFSLNRSSRRKLLFHFFMVQSSHSFLSEFILGVSVTQCLRR